MERRPKTFFAVRVAAPKGDVIVLRAPVLLVPERHTDGKGFSPSASLFGSESAMHLLVDMIIANPEYRDHLGAMIRQLA